MTLLLHSSICSDTGTEYGMGGRAWLLGLSDRSVHGVTTEVAGSSLTGMGVANGAGMHCALDRSAEEDENSNGDMEINMENRCEFGQDQTCSRSASLSYLVQCHPEIPAHWRTSEHKQNKNKPGLAFHSVTKYAT